MIIYVDSHGKIVKDKINAIPITLNTKIQLPIYKTTNFTDVVIEDGKQIYLDPTTNNTTTDSENIIKTNLINTNLAININRIEPDEKIYDCILEKNTPKLRNIKKYSIVDVDENNASLFNIDDILNEEYLNKLNETTYDYLVYDIFNSIDPDSVFTFANKFKIVLYKNDFIRLKINEAINDICLNNINPELDVHINGKSPTCADEYNSIYFDDINANDGVTVDIINNTNNKINLINMFIIYR